MVLHNVVKKNMYQDSVFLMTIAAAVRALEGVDEVACVMGTPANLKLLSDAGMLAPEAAAAGANDLVLCISALDDEAGERAADEADRLLQGRNERREGTAHRPAGLESARELLPGANLALFSIPGPYVKREARRALDAGLNVFIFSDNVPVADEIELKRLGADKGLLVMGPDCGTAIVDGIAIGFANVVRRGYIGIVAAAGTGLQEVSCLIDREGAGVSQAIGTGGRDLSVEVGGLTMLEGIRRLEADPATKVICLVSKPPDDDVANLILEELGRGKKRYVVNFLGQRPGRGSRRVRFASSLEEAALVSVAWSRGEKTLTRSSGIDAETLALSEALGSNLATRRRYIRGLFTGGTLCDEAMLVLSEVVGDVWSNIPLDPRLKLADSRVSQGHCLVDLGDDEFTQGRPHPMIDSESRNQRIVQEAEDKQTAVLLLDVVLGYGSHPDPAGAMAASLKRATDRDVAVVASLTGTPADPQGYHRQKRALNEMGVVVMPSNAQAARFAALVCARGKLAPGGGER